MGIIVFMLIVAVPLCVAGIIMVIRNQRIDQQAH
jgi:hypothetical protein